METGSVAAPRNGAASTADIASVAERVARGRERVLAEIRKVIVGQDEVIDQVLMALFTGGHCLITGVPGLAKTLLIKTVAQILDLSFKRIQFTPDLMPADITGTEVLDEQAGQRSLRFVKGPIFAHIILADEINRTPPKTQAALLEAMQEHRVTIQGRTYDLEEPFFVFATQNPIELEGTYPLPEAQLDRFMFEIIIEHMPEDDELEVVRATTSIINEDFRHVVTAREIVAFQQLIRKVPVAEPVLRYAVALTRASRPAANSPEFIKEYVAYGASVRAAQHMVLGAKARSLMSGRYHVSFEDVRALAHPVMRHRIIRNFHAESEKVSTDDIITRLLAAVPQPRSGM